MHTLLGHRGLLGLAALGAMSVLASGCVQQVQDIDRTQPNKLLKSDFEGTWYFRQTVTDVPAEIDYTFIGYTSTQEKLVWDIREDYLIGYRAYESQPGTDPGAGAVVKGKTMVVDGGEEGFDPSTYKGEPVAAFRITSHFDVQRQYNTMTGEQQNVIVENSSDKPWDERKYMRVDWSKNYINELFFMADMNSVSSVQYFVQEHEGGPDAFVKERRTITRGGEKKDELAYFDFVSKLQLNPDLESCWYYGLNCIPGEIKVRSSFARLKDDESDYEPAFYDDRAMNKFGFFRVERDVYDRREGVTDTKRLLYANRHDIWKNDYKRDANGEYLRNSKGERVPTPMAEREPKPVVYYVSTGFPEDLWDSAQGIATDWDRALTRAVAAAKNLAPADITAQYGPMYVLCHNPVTAEDPDVCDPRPLDKRDGAFTVRNGDLRYSSLWWVDRPQAAGPLGYGPAHPDPETGEIISGTAYVYGAGVDTYAQHGVDIVKMVNGDFTPEELQDGLDVTEYLKSTRRDDIDPRALRSPEATRLLENTPIEPGLHKRMLGNMAQSKLDLLNKKPLADTLSENVTRHQQGLDRLRRAGWDKRLITSEMLGQMSKGKYSDMSALDSNMLDEVLTKYNPLDMQSMLGRRRALHERAQKNNIYLAEFADEAVIEAGLRYQGQTNYEDVWKAIRGEILRGVGAHEVGHSIGLRHNFQGSYDAINFFDKYWDLRKENLKSPQTLDDIYSQTRMTTAQAEGGMRGYQYSSIMDYHSRFNGDWAGVGKYDEAAILFAYTFGTYESLDDTYEGPSKQEAGYVEVFETLPASGGALVRQYDGRTSPANRSLLEDYHYATAVQRLGGPDSIKARQLMRFSVLEPMRAAGDPQRPLEVPYMFCSDEIAGALISCNRFDLGADPLELVQSARDNYFTYYPLTHFRRERAHFDPNSALNRAYNTARTFLNVYQQWLIGYQNVEDDFLNTYYVIAAYAGFNTMAEMMTMPRYGTFSQGDDGRWEWESYDVSTTDPNKRVIAMGPGRRLRSIYDDKSGYYYFARLKESGHFWDWIGAMFVAIEPIARTVAVDTAADREAYTLPFYLLFEEEMTALFNGQITKDFGPGTPLVGADGKITRPPMAPLDAGQMIDPLTGELVSNMTSQGDAVLIEPNLTQELYASLYGIAFFNELYTQHYVDQARVFRLGNGEQVDVAPGSGFEVATFTDPTTGMSYGTIQPVGGSANPGLGETLVAQGKELEQQLLANPGDQDLEFELGNVVDKINMIGQIILDFGGAD